MDKTIIKLIIFYIKYNNWHRETRVINFKNNFLSGYRMERLSDPNIRIVWNFYEHIRLTQIHI